MQDNDTRLIETFNTSRQQQVHLWQQALRDTGPSTTSSSSSTRVTNQASQSSSTARVDDYANEFQRLHEERRRIENKMEKLKRKEQEQKNRDSIRKRQRLCESYQAHSSHPQLRIGTIPIIDIYEPMDWQSLRKEIEQRHCSSMPLVPVNIQCEGLYKNEDCVGEVDSIKYDKTGKLKCKVKWPNNTRAITIKDDQHVTMVSGYIACFL